MLIRGPQHHLVAVSGGSQRRCRPVDWVSDRCRSSLLLTGQTCLFFSSHETTTTTKNLGFSKDLPSGIMLSIGRFVNMCVRVCVCPSVCLYVCFFTFEVPFKRLFAPHFLKSDVKNFERLGILGEKLWKKVVSDWKTFTNKGCKTVSQKR